MAKISQLPLVTDPDGTETFVVLKDGMAQRVPGAALIGAAGDVSLEQVQAAASRRLPTRRRRKAQPRAPRKPPARPRPLPMRPPPRPTPPPPLWPRSCCPHPALT
jgi:hypothetical protein